jgi:hypothetical protein
MISSEEYIAALNLYIPDKDEDAVRAIFGSHPEFEVLIGYCRGDHGRDPIGIPAVGRIGRYNPPQDAEYWPAVWELHRDKKRWNDTSLGELDKSTSRIMSHLISTPYRTGIGHYGLVVGYVQSGKTSNYTALCAKAADYGYNLIIILSGLYNDLRSQTQSRLLRELAGTERDHRDGIHVLGELYRNPWKTITDNEKDFHNLKFLQPFSEPERPHLIVTKKNVAPLEKLTQWIKETPPEIRSEIKALIIDDEADHGSIDTQTGEVWDPKSMQFQRSESEINKRLRLLLKTLKSGYSYVGYTATPMANIFINPEIDDEGFLGPSLYPNDFIISLGEPDGYFGINKVHPRGEISPCLVRVPNAEAAILREVADDDYMMDKTPLPQSLEDAMIQYILSWSIRCLRGQREQHHSMLIHVKHTIESMTPLVRKVREKFDRWEGLLGDAYEEEADELRTKFKQIWEDTYKDTLDPKYPSPSWTDILDESKKLMAHNKPSIVEINSESKDTLDYQMNYKNGWRALVIGGTRLSRGLTIEGLCISYFVRHAGAHDTLLQMGRWFGFRHGYEDLVRIHTTGPIISDFMDMVEIERELRADIVEYENHELSPADFGVRVMKHMNNLSPTGRLKMATVELRSFNEDRKIFETPTLSLDDNRVLKKNISVLDDFILSLMDTSDGQYCGYEGQNRMWTNVEPQRVIQFLSHVNFEESKFRMPIQERILPYIYRRLEKTTDELRKWNVVSVGSSKANYSHEIKTKKGSVTLKSVIRTRIPDSNRVGASIAGPWDYIADLIEAPFSHPRKIFENQGGSLALDQMFKLRPKNNPLLLIYILDPDSEPNNVGHHSTREPLFKDDLSKTPVLGIAMALPNATISTEERNREREFYIRLGAASLEDILKSRREIQ